LVEEQGGALAGEQGGALAGEQGGALTGEQGGELVGYFRVREMSVFAPRDLCSQKSLFLEISNLGDLRSLFLKIFIPGYLCS